MTSTRPRPDLSRPASRRRPRVVLALAATTLVLAGLAGSTLIRHDTTTTSAADVRAVVVDIGAGPVTLRGADDDVVDVRSTPYGLFTTSSAPRHEIVDGVLRITSSCSGFAFSCWTREEISVPAGLPVRVHTGVGDVTAVDLDVPTFSVSAGAASVGASFVSAPEELRVSVGAAGNVAITVPDEEYRVDADASLGSEEVRVDADSSAQGTIRASTGVGSITVRPR